MSSQLKAKGNLVPLTKEIKVALDGPEVAMGTNDENGPVLRKLLPTIIVAVALGGLSILIFQLFAVQRDLGDLKGDVGGLGGTMDQVVARIDRIADVLPEMGIRIAGEEIEKAIESALFVTTPWQQSGGEWAAAVHWLKPKDNSDVIWHIRLPGPDSITTIWNGLNMIDGAANTSDVDVVSFDKLEQWSVDVNRATFTPNWVSEDVSFVIRSPAPWISESLDLFWGTIAAQGISVEASKEVKPFPSKSTPWGWPKFANELESNSSFYYNWETVPTGR